ncbi:hypothetical protein SADUNF_Sadunf01G0058400 [Salix dunnii]|uniref:Uncharacterized protein n=1 Tax=Salix dunnii TaxID=1413687 RepID=A0A835TMB1_9ROSI|nr:hypothetical protein SADUNF_Sadunf01G0058400 [Salix dunnii]
MASKHRHTELAATHRKSPTVTARKKGTRRTSSMIGRITSEIVEIREGQKRIKEGQKEVRGKLKEIRKESKKLKDETELITKQSAANQLRLDLMFQILKARAENDSAKDAHLTQTLRFVAPNLYTLYICLTVYTYKYQCHA